MDADEMLRRVAAELAQWLRTETFRYAVEGHLRDDDDRARIVLSRVRAVVRERWPCQSHTNCYPRSTTLASEATTASATSSTFGNWDDDSVFSPGACSTSPAARALLWEISVPTTAPLALTSPLR